MERLIPIIGFIVLSSSAWAQLSSPVILNGTATVPTAAPTTSSPAAMPTTTAPTSKPVPTTGGNTAQSYLPATLSPQAQINSGAPKNTGAATSSPPADSAKQNDLFRQPMTDVNNITNVSAKPKKRLEFRKRKEGGPVYSISVSQPRVEITLYSGSCYAENRRELRQQLLDRGLDTRKKTVLRAAYAATPTGRVKGCWYYVRQGDYFRVALENGQGEDFAREQVDRAR